MLRSSWVGLEVSYTGSRAWRRAFSFRRRRWAKKSVLRSSQYALDGVERPFL